MVVSLPCTRSVVMSPASAPAGGAWWPCRRPEAAPTVDANVTIPIAPRSTMHCRRRAPVLLEGRGARPSQRP